MTSVVNPINAARVLAAAVVIAAGVDVLALRDYALTDRSTFQRPLHFGAGNRTLELRLISGSIHVVRSRNSDGNLDVRRTVRADTSANLDLGRREVALDVDDGGATVRAIVEGPDMSACGVHQDRAGRRNQRYQVTFDVDVAVPVNTALVLCTINGSEITVDGTVGDFDLSNVNGRIRLTDVKGSGSANTVNGSITASVLESPRRDGTFKTVNGAVAVTWPPDLAAALRLKTFNGGLFTDFDVTPDRVEPAAGRRDADGRFVLNVNRHAAVRVGRGGPTVTLETLNGDVRVLRGR
jgi:hypothetical protein